MRCSSLPALCLAVGLVAVLKIGLLIVFGPISANDTAGYDEYAQRILAGSEWVVDVKSTAVPTLAFRMAGYPLVIALARASFGTHWQLAVVLLQMALSLYATYRFGSALIAARAGLRLALFAMICEATSFPLVLDQSLLTDSFYTSFVTLAWVSVLEAVLQQRASIGRAALIGLQLMLAFTLREASLYLFIPFLPTVAIAMWAGSRSIARAVMLTSVVVLPLLSATLAYRAWNETRTGHAFVTTAAHTNMIYAVLEASRLYPSVVSGDGVLETAIRNNTHKFDYDDVIAIAEEWYQRTRIDTIEASTQATEFYKRVWLEHPLAMMGASLRRLKEKYLLLPVRPIESIDDLLRAASTTGDHTISAVALWQQAKAGDLWKLLPLALEVFTQAFSVLTSLVFIMFPISLLLRVNRQKWSGESLALLGLWLFVGGFTSGYALVHLEARHLAPMVPIVIFLAAMHYVLVTERSAKGRRATGNLRDGLRVQAATLG